MSARKCLIGAPDTNKIPPKIINTKRAVPRSRSNRINSSIATNPGASNKIKFFVPGSCTNVRNRSEHHKIKPNFANSDGCNVKPPISIQLRFPFMFFPRNGTNGNNKITIEILSAYLAMNGQIAPLTLNAQNAANEPMIKKKNCLINIEYVFPLSCNEVTVEEDKTMVKPSAHKNMVLHIIKK